MIGDSLVLPAGNKTILLVLLHSQHLLLALRKDDLILFAVTIDGTLRIYFPVVDASHRLQLHAAIDVLSSASPSSRCLADPGCLSSIFWLEKDIGMDCFGYILSKASEQQQQDDGGIKRIRQLHNTGFDFVFRAHSDGSLVLTAVTVSLLHISQSIIAETLA